MAFTIKDASRVCTANELELVKMSRSPAMKRETPARLRLKVDRARKLRDKFRDEAARQTREARGKAEPRGTRAAEGNDRTVLKAEIFAEVLERFETMLSVQEEKADKSTGAAAKTPSKKKTGKVTTSDATAGKATADKMASGKSTKKVVKKTPAKPAKPAKKAAASGASGASTAALTGRASKSAAAAFTIGLPAAESRNDRRRAHHEESKADRVESKFAATNQTRLMGHISAKGKRSQARRDSK